MSSRPRWTRRRLLLLGAAGTALGAATLGGFGLASIQPRRQRLDDPHPDRPERFGAPYRVVVVGGGLAGMSAALELAERGAEVTLLEEADHLGGKLSGWSIDVEGAPYATEHGFHGFFDQYYNLADVLTRLGVDENLERAAQYPLLFADGSTATFTSGKTAPFPFNLASFYFGSEMLEFSALLRAGPPMQALLEYDPVRTYAELDGVDFATFCAEAGMDASLVDYFFRPFAKTSLNDPRRVSAAYLIQFMHFFYLGNPEGLGYRFTKEDCMTSIVDPWRERLTSLGVEISTGTRCSRLLLAEGRVSGVELGGTSTERTRWATFDPSAIGEHESSRIGADPDGAPLFARRSGGEIVVVRGVCTHMGCAVEATAGGFSCPCHGGRFDAEGVAVAGPPKRPLQRLQVIDRDVLAPVARPRTREADAVVLATNTLGTRAIVGNSQVPPALARSIAGLVEADPFAVTRMWFAGEVPREGIGFFTVGGHERLDSIALYERLQSQSRRWAAQRPGSIVELHSYGIPPAEDRGVEGNCHRMTQEFLERMPQWADARLIHSERMQQRTFSGFPPGSHAARPTTATAVDNLVLAGDWVRTDLPVALMEGAVTSGRLAANLLLDRQGIRQAPVETVAPRGPLA